MKPHTLVTSASADHAFLMTLAGVAILVAIALVVIDKRRQILAAVAGVLAETLVGRALRRLVPQRVFAAGNQRGGPFGIPDQLVGMLIGAVLLGAGFASFTVPQAWAETTRCADNLQSIDLGARTSMISTGVAPGAGGTINVTDASLTAYLPDTYTDPTNPTGVYTITDTSDAANNVRSYIITCPGTHMGLTTLRFPNGALTKHVLAWDSNTKITVQ